MLRLGSLEVENYKCLRNVCLNFGDRLTVLIGRNGTGKTTVVDVFSFLSKASTNIQEAIRERGAKIGDLCWAGDKNGKIQFIIEFVAHDAIRKKAIAKISDGQLQLANISRDDLLRGPIMRKVRYICKIGTTTFGETLWINDHLDRKVPLANRFINTSGGVGTTVLSSNLLQATGNSSEDAKLMDSLPQIAGNLHQLPNLLFDNFSNNELPGVLVNEMRMFFQKTYRSFPHRKAEGDMTVSPRTSPTGDGADIAQLIHTLKNNEEETFDLIKRDLCFMVEGITNLSSPISQNNRTSISVRQEIAGSGSLPFAFRDLSTGTQQLIILLCQLHSQPENTMILLEEVEAMLHPSAQAKLTNLLKEHSSTKTIILATHSHIIASRVNLSSLCLCTKSNGEVSVATVKEETIDKVIAELGVMPSYSFEKDIIVFVEGEIDEALCDEWRKQHYANLSIAVINSEGYSKLPFYANAKILRNKAVRIKTYAIVDGDTRAKGDFNRIKNALEHNSDDDILQIDETNIEEFLKSRSQEIVQAFPRLTVEKIDESLEGIADDDLKNAFRKLLRDEGGYNAETIRKLAPFVSPPTYWTSFFDKIATQSGDKG